MVSRRAITTIFVAGVKHFVFGAKKSTGLTDRPNIVAIVAVFSTFLAVMLGVLLVPNDRFVLVIAKPDQSPSAIIDIISDAGGSFVGGTRFSWMAVGYSESAGFPARLVDAGAILVLDHSLALGCLERTKT